MPPKRKKAAQAQGNKRRKGGSNNEAKIRDMVKKEEVQDENDIEVGDEEILAKSGSADAENPDMEDALAVAEHLETRTTLDERKKKEKLSKKYIMDIIKKKSVIPCQECSKKFRFKASFEQHMRLEHSKLKTSVPCDKCHVRCPNQKTLKEHISKFHEREMFECPQCKKTFVRHAHVLRHMAQTGCDGTQALIFPCEICGAKFTRKDNLMVHLRLQHITRKQHACKLCSFSSSSFSKLCVHMEKYHAETEKRFECDHCGKVVSSRPAMYKHLEIHGDKKYACDVCGYSTHTIEVMRRHVLTHVQDKPYKCEVCGRSFIQSSQLQRHKAKHSDTGDQKRRLILPNKAEIFKHLKEQKDIPLLSCPVEGCDVLASITALRQHIKKHYSSDRPFACEVCGKCYRNSMDMRRHVLSHTLERPRRCMYCVQARAYTRGIQLVRHVRKMHPAVFKEHLTHVRQVLGSQITVTRVKKSELESILNVLDAEAERILEGYGEGVLYGGMQEPDTATIDVEVPALAKRDDNPLMSEDELADHLNKLLIRLIDKELLECFGWPNQTVDTVLEKVIEHCGAKAADREKWTRVQCLRENTKHLFLYVIEDKNISRMLDSFTIDQIVKHILTQVSENDTNENKESDEEEIIEEGPEE